MNKVYWVTIIALSSLLSCKNDCLDYNENDVVSYINIKILSKFDYENLISNGTYTLDSIGVVLQDSYFINGFDVSNQLQLYNNDIVKLPIFTSNMAFTAPMVQNYFIRTSRGEKHIKVIYDYAIGCNSGIVMFDYFVYIDGILYCESCKKSYIPLIF